MFNITIKTFNYECPHRYATGGIDTMGVPYFCREFGKECTRGNCEYADTLTILIEPIDNAELKYGEPLNPGQPTLADVHAETVSVKESNNGI